MCGPCGMSEMCKDCTQNPNAEEYRMEIKINKEAPMVAYQKLQVKCAKLIAENVELKKQNSEQKKQIKKMKCCANCKHYFCMCENVDDEKQYCDKWELAE